MSFLPLASWLAAAAGASDALASRSLLGGAATGFVLAFAAYVMVARRPSAKVVLAANRRSSRRDDRLPRPNEETTT